MTGEWLPPQAPGSTPPPPVAPGAPPPPAPFEPPQEPGETDPAAAPPPPAPRRPEEQNSEAVAGMVCAVTGTGLLYLSSGLSTLVSLILGVVGVVYARRGKRNVEEGKTDKHRDLATAAQIAGWITIGLSILATLVWVALLIFAEGSDWDFETSWLLR